MGLCTNDEMDVRRTYRRNTRRGKRSAAVYLVRGMLAVCIAAAVFLMGCGCLYLRERFVESREAGNISEEQQFAGNGSVVAGSTEVAGVIEAARESLENDQNAAAAEEDIVIVLDAGHGGNDGGTFSGDIIEKDITLEVVKYMKSILEEQDITVILTRDRDDYMSLEERVEVENQVEADMFVSIHCNSWDGDSSVNGLECYYLKNSEVEEELAQTFTEVLREEKDTRIRDPKEDTFYVLKFTKCPAILVELGFLSNEKECQNLIDPEYQEELAEDLVNCIIEGLTII